MNNLSANGSETLEKTFSILEKENPEYSAAHHRKLAGLEALLKGKIHPEAIKEAFEIVSASYDILPGRKPDALLERVRVHFGEMEPDLSQKVLSWIVFGTENGFDASGSEDALSQQLLKSYGMAEDRPLGETVENATGAFGFAPTNPIPVDGIDRINDYFSRLRTETGETLTFKRIRSQQVEGLPFPVDQYEVFNSDNKLVAILYVYAYHGEFSSKVPEGFRLVSEEA